MNDQSKEPRRPGMGTSAAVQEVLSRSRRIETRLTQLLVTLGYDSDTQKPIFAAGPPARIELPSPHSSIREILTSIPEDHSGPVEIQLGSKVVGTLLARPDDPAKN